jgi:hypothetical protein
MKTFPKLNVLWKGRIANWFRGEKEVTGTIGFSVANFADTVTLPGSQLMPSGIVQRGLRKSMFLEQTCK